MTNNMKTPVYFYNLESGCWLTFDYLNDINGDRRAHPHVIRSMVANYDLMGVQRLLDEISYAAYKYEVDHGMTEPDAEADLLQVTPEALEIAQMKYCTHFVEE